MGFSIKFDRVKSGWSIVYIEGSHVMISPKCFIPFSADGCCLANSSDPNEVLRTK